MQKSMIEGNTLKLILNFSIPLLLGNLFQQFYNVVDAAIVGQTLGSYALAAVGASSSVQFLILGFCMGICQGFSIMVSQSFGAKRLDEMHTYIYAGAAWTAITAFCGIHLSRCIFVQTFFTFYKSMMKSLKMPMPI